MVIRFMTEQSCSVTPHEVLLTSSLLYQVKIFVVVVVAVIVSQLFKAVLEVVLGDMSHNGVAFQPECLSLSVVQTIMLKFAYVPYLHSFMQRPVHPFIWTGKNRC